jgi:hypothetical protein
VRSSRARGRRTGVARARAAVSRHARVSGDSAAITFVR